MNWIKPDFIGKPANHQFYFTGERPHYINGTPIMMLSGGEGGEIALPDGTQARFHFSMKLTAPDKSMRDYDSLFEKVITYSNVISGPALTAHPDAELTGPIELADGRVSPFVFPDTMSAFSELESLNIAFYDVKVGVIGVGGTGSYLVDFLAKMPLQQILLIDGDEFEIKNSYRSPGVPTANDFGGKKVDYLVSRYAKFHTGVNGHAVYLTDENSHLIDGLDFVFLCVDKGSVRIEIANILRSKGIPFIDTGLGLENSGAGLKGMMRSTFVDDASYDIVVAKKKLPSNDVDEDNAYRKIVQIAELNALNASLAIVRFKKAFRFYGDERPSFSDLFVVHRSVIFSELMAEIP